MAISQNFLTGRMRKSAGGTRFSTWRGLNIVASKPISVRQNVTPAVKLNQEKMSVVGKLVSKMNPIVSDMYSLGIAKTTPFADTVKFFRNRLLDSLKLDASMLSNATFGTGNIPSAKYYAIDDRADNFAIEIGDVPSIIEGQSVQSTIIVVNDTCTKVCISQLDQVVTDSIVIDLTSYGFVQGDKVQCGIRPKLSQPGADLSGKVKFLNSTSFITLT